MKKLCLNEFLLSLLVSDLEKRPLVVHFQTIEYSLTKPNKDIPSYYIDYNKTSYLKKEFCGIQNPFMNLISYDQLNND